MKIVKKEITFIYLIGHYFLSVNNFFAIMFEDEEALWALTVSSGVLVGLLFLPWL
jgi:hypothetical protein